MAATTCKCCGDGAIRAGDVVRRRAGGETAVVRAVADGIATCEAGQGRTWRAEVSVLDRVPPVTAAARAQGLARLYAASLARDARRLAR